MTDWPYRILTNARLIAALVGVLVIAGMVSFYTMDRQENPSFPYRGAIVIIPFPGASAERVERLVLEPAETQINEIDEIYTLGAIAQQDVGVFSIELRGDVYNTAEVWDRLRVALKNAQRDFPDGVLEPRVNDRIIDSSLMMLAVTGDASPMELAEGARTLRKALLDVDGVASTSLYGDPGRQVTVAIEDAVIDRYALSLARIARDINESNQVKGGGSLRLGDASINLNPQVDFQSIEEIGETPIRMVSGQTLPLASIADVSLMPESPPRDEFWYNGRRAVGVEVVAARGQNQVELGQRLRAAAAEVGKRIAPLEIGEVFYQPALTQDRLHNLSLNLLSSIAAVMAVLVCFMGWRMGLVVATLLPLVTFSALAVYAMGGGVLHQVAVIGLVVALGVLVDNAIVMTEEVQYGLNAGQGPQQAAAAAIRSLAGPLFAATGTTVAAFVPVLLAKGNTTDFVRALPITIIVSLSASYLFAITVTPLIAHRFLKPMASQGRDRLNALGEWLARLTLGRPRTLMLASVGAFLLAMALEPFLGETFFPEADQNIVVVDVVLPDGVHQSSTAAAARQVNDVLITHEGVEALYSFVGTGGPPFYYNLQKTPRAPNLARLVVRTDGLARNQELIEFLDDYKKTHLPSAQIIARKLSQGPLVTAPLEVEIYADTPAERLAATNKIYDVLRELPGTRNVRHTLGSGVPSLDFDINSAIARDFKVSPVDVANSIRSHSDGLIVGEYRGDDSPMFIRLRSPEGELSDPAALETVNVYNERGEHVPLMQVATPRLEVAPGAIRRKDGARYAAVYGELEEGVAYSSVIGPWKEKVAALDLPESTRLVWRGFAATSGDANAALLGMAPLGIGLLLLFLLLQFNSFVRIGLVLLTVPFAIVGVIPGLLLLDIPFGFMPMLGLFALVGIVVNNAIVLIDVIDQRLGEGASLAEAVADAVERRTRPIVLTTATTIVGLLPLAFSSATLWPPLAWSIISGLLASTVLTLMALPAFCQTVLAWRLRRPGPTANVVLVAALTLGLASMSVAPPANAQDTGESNAATATVDFASSLRRAAARASVRADSYDAEAARHAADALRRISRYPTLSVNGYYSRSEDEPRYTLGGEDGDLNDVVLNTPAGDIPASVVGDGYSVTVRGEREQRGATVSLRQPLFNLATQRYLSGAAEDRVSAAEWVAQRSRIESMVDAANAYIDVLSAEAQLTAARSLVNNLESRNAQVQALRDTGNALKSEALSVRYALSEARQRLGEFDSQVSLAQANLARTIGAERPVRARPLNFEPPALTGSVDALVDRALAQRQDLAALQAGIESARQNSQAVSAARLPTLDAVASSTYADGDPALPDNDNRVSLQVSWTPFAGGAISARKAQAEAERNKLLAQLDDARTGIALEVRKAVADYRNAQSRYRTARLGLDSAQATRRTRAAQWDVGELGIQELLEAESDVARKRAEYDVAGYRRVSAWVALQSVLGAGDRLYDLPAGVGQATDDAARYAGAADLREPVSTASVGGAMPSATRSSPVDKARPTRPVADSTADDLRAATQARVPVRDGSFGRLARFKPIEWRAAYFTPVGRTSVSQLNSQNIGLGRLRLSQWQPPAAADDAAETTITETDSA